MEQTSWFLLVNPESGGGKGRRMCPLIEGALRKAGISYSLHLTSAAGEAVAAVQKAIAGGFRHVIAAGGDGTFNETANGIITQNTVHPSAVTLALIPAGTGNDWIRSRMIPSRPEKAVELILSGHTEIFPAGLIRFRREGKEQQRWFVNVAGCGFDAMVAAAANEAKARGNSGVLTYIIQLARTLFRYREEPAIVQVNGKQIRLKLFSVLAGIGQYAGNGMKLVPGAGAAPGRFSITLVRKISRLKVILNFFRLFSGSFTRLREVTVIESDELEVLPSGRLPVQADGESIGEAPVSLRIYPGMIKLIVP